MHGTSIYGFNELETRYCAWHDTLRTPSRAGLATDFAAFERWCLDQRARGYCGEFYEFAHADAAWLVGLITGDDQTPLEPTSRVGCAKRSCPYGWSGQSAADAFRLDAAPVVSTWESV
jgi:hypothetical protein